MHLREIRVMPEKVNMGLFAKQFYDYFIEKQFLEKIKQQRKQDKRFGALKPTRVQKDKEIIEITLSDILDYFAAYGIDVVNIIDPSCRSVSPEELICVLNGSRVKKRERDTSHVNERAGTKKRKNKRHTSKRKLQKRNFYKK
jgi:L-lactate utilization protein LutC